MDKGRENRGDLHEEPQREEHDDHDLLTYGEVGVRLHQEVVALQSRIGELEAGGETEKAAAARRRLEALEDARGRNSRSPINSENFERFFGYQGTPKRNT